MDIGTNITSKRKTNYKNCCLTCLEETDTDQTQPVESLITIGGENVKISDILMDIYQYQVPDMVKYSDKICLNCTYQLTISYSFKTLIKMTAKTLTENLDAVVLLDINNVSDNCYESEKEDATFKPNIVQQINRTFKRRRNMQCELYCVECKDLFTSSHQLRIHCKEKHTVLSQTGRECDFCPTKFEDMRSLVYHRKLHLKPYICDMCWEGFYNLHEIQDHVCIVTKTESQEDKHTRTLKQCDQCGKSYPPGYIRVHMLIHSDDRPYSCKYCPKKFKVPGGLKSHELWNHKRTKNHVCDVCNATFISASARSSHVRKFHLKEKKYLCKCGKRFFSKSELDRHTLTHTGVKNFHCHLCEKSYQTRYGLNVHLKSHSHTNIL